MDEIEWVDDNKVVEGLRWDLKLPEAAGRLLEALVTGLLTAVKFKGSKMQV